MLSMAAVAEVAEMENSQERADRHICYIRQGRSVPRAAGAWIAACFPHARGWRLVHDRLA